MYISLKLLREPTNINAILRLMHLCFNQRQQLTLRLCQTTIFVKITIILIWTGTDALPRASRSCLLNGVARCTFF